MHGTAHGWSFRVPPGWPIPPAGWAPPAGWQPDPSWPQPPQGWVLWVPSQSIPGQRRTTVADYWPTPARSRGKRAALMALYLFTQFAAMQVLGFLTGLVLAFVIQPWDYPSDAAYEAALNDKLDLILPIVMLAGIAAWVLVFGLLAQRAGYRGAGFLLVLVPVWGTVVMCRVLWRWTDIKHWQDVPTQVGPPLPRRVPQPLLARVTPTDLDQHQPAR